MKIQANKTTLLAAILVLVITASIAYAVPSATPPTSNVDANFSSVTIGTGGYIQLPATGPNRITGSFGRWIGNTSSTSNGLMSGPGGLTSYRGTRAICANGFASTYPNSHVCTAREIINTYEYTISLTPQPALPTTGYAWINNGPPAYLTDVSNDCSGWTDNNSTVDTRGYSMWGSMWSFADKNALMTTCDANIPIACCSY